MALDKLIYSEMLLHVIDMIDILIMVVIGIAYLNQIYFLSISLFSIIYDLKDEVWLKDDPKYDKNVAILIPLYKEECKSIDKTVKSIFRQNYRKELLRVIMIVEMNDLKTENCAKHSCEMLNKNGIKASVLVRSKKRSLKAAALNDALNYVKEEIIVVYDADDEIIDPDQIAKGVSLITKGYDAVGVKVLRVGESITQTLSYIDTFFWVNVSLPGITKISGYPLLSGEGLFVSKKALEKIGGFPDSLTEDSMLTVEFAKNNLKIGLLDSVVHENSPRKLKALVKQRIRWHKGYAQCFIKTLKSKIPAKLKIVLAISYTSPISLIVIAFSLIYILSFLFLSSTIHILLFPEILILSLFSIITALSAPIYLIKNDKNISRKESFYLLLLYWSLLGIATIYSFLVPKIEWYKTERF